MQVEQLRPRRAEHEQRSVRRPLHEVLEERQQRRIGPVQILEHEHERRSIGHLVEIPLPGGEHLFTLAGLAGQPDQRRQPGAQPRCVLHAFDGGSEVVARIVLAGRLGDREMLLDDLANGQKPIPSP